MNCARPNTWTSTSPLDLISRFSVPWDSQSFRKDKNTIGNNVLPNFPISNHFCEQQVLKFPSLPFAHLIVGIAFLHKSLSTPSSLAAKHPAQAPTSAVAIPENQAFAVRQHGKTMRQGCVVDERKYTLHLSSFLTIRLMYVILVLLTSIPSPLVHFPLLWKCDLSRCDYLVSVGYWLLPIEIAL